MDADDADADAVLLSLIEESLLGLSPQRIHHDLLCWLTTHGQANRAVVLAETWLPLARGVGRAELLCALARAQHLQGLQVEPLLHQAESLAAAEWSEAERAWGALGLARLALGDRLGAHHAWTHPESPYTFEARAGLTALACAHLQAGDWSRLEAALAHIGPGHDQAYALEQVIADALHRGRLGDALSALWWIPETLREGALLRAVWGLVQAGKEAEGWAIEAQWDGLEDGEVSRALADLLLGDLTYPREITAAAGEPRSPAEGLYLALLRTGLADVAGALACLERLSGPYLQLHGARLAARLFPAGPWPLLLAGLAARADTPETRIAVARVWGLLEGTAGHSRLRQAAEDAAVLEDFYARRLALQQVAHAQLQAGDAAGGLETAGRLSSARFGEEHHIAAAIWHRQKGDRTEVARILGRLPLKRRGEAGVEVLTAGESAGDQMLLAWDICVT